MTYLYGHQSKENETLQVALAKLGLYRGKIDGKHLAKTRDAVIEAQLLYGIDPHDGIVRGDLLLELGITAPRPPRSNPLKDIFTGLAMKAVLNHLKGIPQMQFLLGSGTAVTGTIMIVVGAASLLGAIVPLGPINGFTPLEPGEAVMSITNGCGFLFLRRAITKVSQ